MTLFPRDGADYVVYCRGGDLHVFSRAAWEEKKSEAEPLFRLSEAEGASLAWFLRYWLGEQRLRPGYNMARDVNAKFDF